MALRPYQQAAADAVVCHTKKRLDPCLLELATGAGKSHIVAALAEFFAEAAPTKRVLCIAPSQELVEQNHEKYTSNGFMASIYCSSSGQKCLRQQVIFASPRTAIGGAAQIAHLGISAIIIDEAHGMTPTVIELIEKIKNYEFGGKRPNERTRVIGMTATPYRTKTGYIYAVDGSGHDDTINELDAAIYPYFGRLLYKITVPELTAGGFLSPVIIGDNDGALSYDTSELVVNSGGAFTAKSVSKTFNGNTKTEKIINKVVGITEEKNRKGAMIFASTISHAHEICGYLPDGQWRVVTGTTKKAERREILADFKAKTFKYIVNVDVLTTGFDAPHVDLIAILRATESPGLLQQMIGRGLRIDPQKSECIFLDYAENISRHGLESDLFSPEIRAGKISGGGAEISVTCPCCLITGQKKRRSDDMYKGLAHDRYGNFLISGTEEPTEYDADGKPCEWRGETLMMHVIDPSNKDEFGEFGLKEIPVPAHYSRRCANPEAHIIGGVPIPCTHRYSLKICPECFAENDIAARHCIKCRVRMVDPNKKLSLTAGAGLNVDGRVTLAEGETKKVKCFGASFRVHISPSGNKTLRTEYSTEIGRIVAWHSTKQHWIFNKLSIANGHDPESVLDYEQCENWSVHPHAVIVKKTIQDGRARFDIKKVCFTLTDEKEE